MKQPNGFQTWEESVPDSIRGDVLWRMTLYRLALFLGDLAWADAATLHRGGRTRRSGDQLYRTVGSICANVVEGDLRGSAREARDGYDKARHRLGPDVTEPHFDLLAEIRRHLLGTIRKQPGRTLREPGVSYTIDGEA